MPAPGQWVSGSLIGGDNIQIGAVAGSVVIMHDRPAYRLVVLTPGNQLPVVPDWQQQPSYLLDAQRQVVPFRPRSRDAELATLTAWRDDSSARVSLRLVHGPGGQGKTRLASRFASHAHAAGWMVAQAVDKHPGLRGRLNHELNLSSVSGMGLLVVVDYAERWRLPVLVQLVGDLVVDDADRQVRVLLLARPGQRWWEDLRSELGRSCVEVAEPLELGPFAKPGVERIGAFDQAVEAFTQALGAPAARIPPPRDVAHPDYGTPLVLHMAALAAVCAHRDGEAVPGREELSAFLLEHERRGWARVAASLAADARYGAISVDALERTVLVATLFGPLRRDLSFVVFGGDGWLS